MGNDKNERTASGFRRPTTNGKENIVADWGSLDMRLIVELIQTASKKGGAVRFGYTRDGGAYAIGVYCGDDYFTDYVRPNEDIDLYLQTLTESFRDWVPSEVNPPKAKGNKR